MRPQAASKLLAQLASQASVENAALPDPESLMMLKGAPRWHMPYTPAPRFIQMETMTACNAKCPFCPQRAIRRKPSVMPDATWKKIIDQTRGMHITYRPFLTNEPFLDKRQVKIIAYIKKRDPAARIEYNTNGAVLTEELGRRLLDAGVDVMRFSVDGFSQKTYGMSRVGLSYERVLQRVTKFLELWDRGGFRDTTFTEMRMIEMPQSRHEIPAYKKYWGPRCSEVIVTPLYQWPWTGQKPQDVVLKPCLKILDEMFFFADGKATLCCWDVNARAAIGDVHAQSAMEIWTGYLARQMRGILNHGRRDIINLCSRCNAYKNFDFSPFKVK